jgi:uncharacterized protein YutD
MKKKEVVRITKNEMVELESYRSLFDELLLKQYPNTVITRFNLSFPNTVEEQTQDELYFKRLEEVIDWFNGTDLFNRYDELLDKFIDTNVADVIDLMEFEAEVEWMKEVLRRKFLN